MEDLLRQLDGQEDGEGDLLEDFVLSATEAKVHMLLADRQLGRSFVLLTHMSISLPSGQRDDTA